MNKSKHDPGVGMKTSLSGLLKSSPDLLKQLIRDEEDDFPNLQDNEDREASAALIRVLRRLQRESV